LVEPTGGVLEAPTVNINSWGYRRIWRRSLK